jgi:hypothetical protein
VDSNGSKRPAHARDTFYDDEQLVAVLLHEVRSRTRAYLIHTDLLPSSLIMYTDRTTKSSTSSCVNLNRSTIHSESQATLRKDSTRKANGSLSVSHAMHHRHLVVKRRCRPRKKERCYRSFWETAEALSGTGHGLQSVSKVFL